MNIGFYAGSFDPFTNGHLHIVKSASFLFDKVFVGIGTNQDKKRRYDKVLMKQGIEQVFKDNNLNNCEVLLFDNLTCDVAKKLGANFLIRGIRNSTDYDYEENLACINEELAGLDTIYLRAGYMGFVSSSMVYELIKNGKDVRDFVPKQILDIINRD